MLTNRKLILPYAAPFLAYVFIASAFGDILSIEVNYIIRLILVTSLLTWAWKWYVPIKGPESPFLSVLIGVVAGLIGLILWLLILTPFTDSTDNNTWSGAAFSLRFISAGFLVPVFEEILMRGFVFRLSYQWGEARKQKGNEPLQSVLDDKCINDVYPGAWSWSAIIISTLVFTSGHHVNEWPAAIAFGLLMSFLWILRKDLIVCIVAHSVTNISLAFYVLNTRSWHLW